jgi:hypothetical protein
MGSIIIIAAPAQRKTQHAKSAEQENGVMFVAVARKDTRAFLFLTTTPKNVLFLRTIGTEHRKAGPAKVADFARLWSLRSQQDGFHDAPGGAEGVGLVLDGTIYPGSRVGRCPYEW